MNPLLSIIYFLAATMLPPLLALLLIKWFLGV